MKLKNRELVDVDSILSIEIDNSWDTEDFSNVFEALSRLYSYHRIWVTVFDKYKIMGGEYGWNKNMKKLPEYLELLYAFKNTALRIFQSKNLSEIHYLDPINRIIQSPTLYVHKVKYGSKGSIDLLGIGKIFELLVELLVHYFPNRHSDLKNILTEKEIEEREQKIIQMKIENLKSLGLSMDEILTIMGYEGLFRSQLGELIKQDKIQNILIKKQGVQ